MGNKERIEELKAEIRRLEAEEYANYSPRLDVLQELVTRTGYFRCGHEFFKTAAVQKVSCNDRGMFSVGSDDSVSLYSDNNRTYVSFYREGAMHTFELEQVVPITEAEFLAAKEMYDSVRSQVSSFINQYCKDDGQR